MTTLKPARTRQQVSRESRSKKKKKKIAKEINTLVIGICMWYILLKYQIVCYTDDRVGGKKTDQARHQTKKKEKTFFFCICFSA